MSPDFISVFKVKRDDTLFETAYQLAKDLYDTKSTKLHKALSEKNKTDETRFRKSIIFR